MEPFTAARLRERRSNRTRDFVAVAASIGVSHLLIFSRAKTSAAPTLRIARLPRGPGLTFRITAFSLARDIRALSSHPRSPGSDFLSPPLVVLNNFPAMSASTSSSGQKHLALVSSFLQNMFPPIRVHAMRLADARRVVLFNYNPESGHIEFRHYAITVRFTGISKSVKTIIRSNVPDLHSYQDISDFIMRGAFASESDVEDAAESTVTLPQKYVGKGNRKSEQRAIRLVEIGPRLELELIKIQAGLFDGEVLYHAFIKKDKEEIIANEAKIAQRESERAQRRSDQARNVEEKQRVQAGTTDADDDDKDQDQDETDADCDSDEEVGDMEEEMEDVDA